MSKRPKAGNMTVLLNLTRKSGEDQRTRRPDYRVKMEVDGEQFEAGLWINDDIGGVPVNMSGQITRGRGGDE